MKSIIGTLCLIGCSFLAHAQYLYGTSLAVGMPTALVRFDPRTNSSSILIPDFPCSQPVSTKDTANKIIYFMTHGSAPGMDTLISVDLKTNVVAKAPLPLGEFGYPEYDGKGKIISLSESGLAEYDLSSRVSRITDPNLRLTRIHSTAFDHTRNRYLLMKKGLSSNMGVDTLYIYDMGTKALTMEFLPLGGTSNEMQFSPASNKIVFDGVAAGTTNSGIYTYDLTTKVLKFAGAAAMNAGLILSCATFDEVGNRYFCVRSPGEKGAAFNIAEYDLNTDALISHNVNSPGVGYAEFFQNVPTAASGIPEENKAAECFAIFPNPASQRLCFSLNRPMADACVRVFDLSGKILLQDHISLTTGENHIDISRLPSGTYIVRVAVEAAEYSKIFEKS